MVGGIVAAVIGALLISSASAQNVYQASAAKAQVLVYRTEAGAYDGCGMRVVATVDSPAPSHLLDYSVNLYRHGVGWVGLSKLLFSRGEAGTKSLPKRRPVLRYTLAPQSGAFTIPLMDMQSSADELHALLARTTGDAALDALTALATEQPLQVGLQLPKENFWRVYVTRPSLDTAEIETLLACLKGIAGPR